MTDRRPGADPSGPSEAERARRPGADPSGPSEAERARRPGADPSAPSEAERARRPGADPSAPSEAERARRPGADRTGDPWAALTGLPPPGAAVAAVAAACAADDPAAVDAALAAHARAAADVLVDLGARARVLVSAVWATGAEPTFLDGAGRLVPGAPAALGAEIGRMLRRRRPQAAAAWREAAAESGATPTQLAAALGVLIETLIDDLAAGTGRPRAEVAALVWVAPTG